MTTLKFADNHNMVAFLAKPVESKGFKEIVDFLNAHTIKKKIIITELIVRRDLQQEDTKGVDCLPNATIFKQLTLIGSKTTAWNKFSSTMASAIICLATNQKFKFSKYIFESMVKNLDNVGKFLMYPRPKRKDTKVPQPSGLTTNVAYEAVNKEMDDSLVRDATTASSLEAEQDHGNIDKTQSKATPNELSSTGPSSGGGPRRQETIGILFLRLETTKTTQANEIASLKRRVKKLKQKKMSRTHGLKRLYKVGSSRRVKSSNEEGLGEEDASKQGWIVDIDVNKDIYLVNVHTDEDLFGVNDLDGDEVIVDNVDVVKTAKEARKLKSAASIRPKVKGIVIHEQEQAPTPTVSSQQPSHVKVQDKGKGKMVEPEPMKKMSKKDLLRLDEELAFKLQAEEEEEERLAREKAQQIKEANIAWDDI
ncbi:hypothetical protein Tco_0277007 [Tanacetum coccineum]